MIRYEDLHSWLSLQFCVYMVYCAIICPIDFEHFNYQLDCVRKRKGRSTAGRRGMKEKNKTEETNEQRWNESQKDSDIEERWDKQGLTWAESFEDRSGSVNQHVVVNLTCAYVSPSVHKHVRVVFIIVSKLLLFFTWGDSRSKSHCAKTMLAGGMQPVSQLMFLVEFMITQSIKACLWRQRRVQMWDVELFMTGLPKVGPLSGSTWPTRCFEQKKKKTI